jgi:predicted ATPase
MVAGDLVNTAARIQSAATPGTVLVGEATRRASAAAIAYEEAGLHELKGKAAEIPLFRALRVTSGRAGALRSSGLEPPFVGRERELRLVKELFHASAEQRKAHLVSVVGIAGIGKSRLGWEFFKYVDGLADTVFWHRGRCLAYGEGVAYWALAEMVRGRAGILEGEEPAAARAKLAASLVEHVPDEEERVWVEPRLANLLGLEERTDADRQDLFAAWRLFFERLSDRYPLVLLFEDMQWADAALLAFVEHLLEWSSSHPVYVLVLARPELAERAPDFGRSVRNAAALALEPLSEAAMSELLDGFAPGLPRELRAQILARAQGVPLYAVETVRMLLDRGLLVQEGAVYRPVREVETLDVPETLHALVAARLDGLEPGERRLVQDASVLGKSFTKAALAALSALEEAELEALLARLVRKEVLSHQADPRSPERGQYAFVQDLLRQVAYETLSRRDRNARHLAAARALAEGFEAAEQEIPEVLASHYLAAYEATPDEADADVIRAQAREMLALAGKRAAAIAAPEEGGRYFEQAAVLAEGASEEARLLERAGELALQANAPGKARALLERALNLYESAGAERLAARASAALANVDFAEDRLDDAATRLEAALVLLDRGEPTVELATALAQLARAHGLRGEGERAAPIVERALALAEALALDATFLEALTTRALVLLFQARVREARGLLEFARTEARSADLGATWWRAANNLAVVYEASDRPREAAEIVEEMLAEARRRGDRHGEAISLAGQLPALVALGRWREALARFHEAEPAATKAPIAQMQLLDIAPVHCEQGEPEKAEALIRRLASARDTESPEARASFAMAEAAVLRARGDQRAALAAAERGVALGSELGMTHRLFKAGLVEALESALALGDLANARALLARIDELPPGNVTPYLRAQAARFRARLASIEGDDDDVQELFDAAARGFRESGFVFFLAVALVEHGEWLGANGRADEATPLLLEAREIFGRLDALPWLDRIDRSERGSPLVTVGS